jgi:flagellar hook-associated protein 2
MRITGFAEGFDSQAMVNALMEVERMPIYRLDEMAYYEEQKLSAWNGVESDVSKLETKVEQLTSLSTWEQMVATTENEDVLTLAADDNAAEGSYDIDVDHLATSHRIGSDAQTDAASPLGLNGDFTIGGEKVVVTADSTLADIRDAINLAAANMADDDKVQAAIIDTTLVIRRQATGSTEINLSDGTGDVLENLGVLDGTKTVKNELTQALDLAATVSGVDISRAENTGLEDVIAGVTLNIHDAGTTTFTVGRDRETVKSLINDFVSAYNATMAKVESAGEATVQSGEDVVPATLQGDSLLRSLQTRSRTIVTAADDSGTLDTNYNSLRKIGIWTTGRDNRLSVTDTEALDDALENHFDEVEDLFRDFNAGVLRQFDDYLDTLTSPMEGAINRRQQSIQSKIDGYSDKIGNLERSLDSYEEQLWEQFTTMESVIAGFQNQSAYLNSLFTSIGVSNDN